MDWIMISFKARISFCFVLLFIPILVPAHVINPPLCQDQDWMAFPVSEYRAKARLVPPLKSDGRMQAEFNDLFQGQQTYDSPPIQLNMEEVSHISNMCPRSAFFSSMAPSHAQAASHIHRMYMSQQSPPDMLNMAKWLANTQVNPKAWYYGLMSASIERSDMAGINIPCPIQAMPDMFIPGELLLDATHNYRSSAKWKDGLRSNSTTKRPRKKARKPRPSKKPSNKISKYKVPTKNETISTPTPPPKKSKRKLKRPKKNKRKPKSVSRHDSDCLLIDGRIGFDNGPENQLWYFREDLLANQHHWYWHMEYPFNGSGIFRPRRAELFYYMHRNLVARYNAERYSNGMPKVLPFDLHPGAEVRTAYNSHLIDLNSGQWWAPRPFGVELEDIIHQDDPAIRRNIFIGEYNQLFWRLVKSVQFGHLFISPLRRLRIKNRKGIEPLGNTIEASELSANPDYYDMFGFHNLGHQLIGLVTDPKFRRRLAPGVMVETGTTMRDPEFYSFHQVVDELFDKHKRTLNPYLPRGGEFPLQWDGVEIVDIQVISEKPSKTPNQLRTFWNKEKFLLSPGLNGCVHKGDLDVDVCAVHLDHEPFDFKITIKMDACTKSETNRGTMRIFLAPRFSDGGARLSLLKQRRQMIHLDSFPVELKTGKNVIWRRSHDSNLVTDWKRGNGWGSQGSRECGCGWPKHLYIPKGSKEGKAFDIFVMVTNFDYDYVQDEHDSNIEGCRSPFMFCGLRGKQYPDRKPMGYPFDRLPFNVPINCPLGVISGWTYFSCKILQLFLLRPVESLEEYVGFVSNMGMTIVDIKHLDYLAW